MNRSTSKCHGLDPPMSPSLLALSPFLPAGYQLSCLLFGFTSPWTREGYAFPPALAIGIKNVFLDTFNSEHVDKASLMSPDEAFRRALRALRIPVKTLC